MKTLITLVVGVLAGLAIGWYGGYRYHDRHTLSQAVDAMVQGMESSDAVAASRSVRAIEFIESGETEKAVRMLSRPIADYYSEYSSHPNTERRQQLCAMIEELVATNKIVAVEVTNAASFEVHGRNQ